MSRPVASDPSPSAAGFSIGELVALTPVRTVVQMADAEDPALSEQLVATFVITEEVAAALLGLLGSIAAGSGRGAFLRGSYGSGKSHFLAALSLLFSAEGARAALSRSLPPDNPALARVFDRAVQRRLLVVPISLVGHRAQDPLEEVVWEACSRALRRATGRGLAAAAGDVASLNRLLTLLRQWDGPAVDAFLRKRQLGDLTDLPAPEAGELLEALIEAVHAPFRLRFQREAALSELAARLPQAGFDGVLFAIDELSEFLRAKADGRRFAEDVRFLQFLGEACERLPAWIVATVQEHIETTGEIPSETFHKIRDRYSLRFHLTGAHIKALIARRIVKKKLGAEEFVRRLYRRLHAALGGLPFGEDEFVALYPVHPGAVELLDQVRPLFSQHRGAVDFIYHRLAGDPRRNIPSLLAAPAQTLLGAEAIFDHFRDRLAEEPATAPYIDQVYAYYARELPRIAPDPEEATLLMRMVKILITAAAAPARLRLSADEMAHLLLYRLTELDPAANTAYIEELLERLVQAGAYVAREVRAGAPLRYYIDLTADASLLVRRRIEQIASTIDDSDGRMLSRLGPWLTEPHLPLSDWIARPNREVELLWQRTRRRGLFRLLQEGEPAEREVAAWETALTEGELEFVFAILPPLDVEARAEALLGRLTTMTDRAARRAVLCWVPQDVAAMGRVAELKRALAHALLHDRLAEEASDAAARLRAHLSELLPEQQRIAGEIFTDAYFQGRLVDATGEAVALPGELGYIPFDQLLERTVHAVLAARYPRHGEIAPGIERLPAATLQHVLDRLGRDGVLERDGMDPAIAQAIAGFLGPMKLAKRAAGGYRIDVDPAANPLVGAFTAALVPGERTPLASIWHALRRGPFGLGRPAFEVLTLTLCHTGVISAFDDDMRRLPLAQLNPARFPFAAVGPGELVSEELQALLPSAAFIPPRLRKLPLTFAAQRDLWRFLIEFKQQESDRLAGLEATLAAVAELEMFRGFDFEPIQREIDGCRAVLAEIKVSHGSQEGIERFLSALRSAPRFAEQLARLQQLEVFCTEDLDRVLYAHRYLSDPRLVAALERLFSERAEILAGHAALRARLAERPLLSELLFDRKAAQRFLQEFAAWQARYAAAYGDAHAAAVHPDRLAPYLELAASSAYQALRRLASVEVLDGWEALETIDAELAAARARACGRSTREILQLQPVCECHFPLQGAEKALRSPTELTAAVEGALRETLGALRRPQFQQRIGAALGASHVPPAVAVAVRSLLRIDLGGDLSNIAGWLEPPVVAFLRRALLAGREVIVRELEPLCRALAGRIFTAAQLRAAIERWLDLPSADAYIRIQPGPDGAAGTASAADFASGHSPEEDA
ncbi:MAG TPA: DUF6079 family protein [Limnochordia bacterium]